jgi:hypothetical protein
MIGKTSSSNSNRSEDWDKREKWNEQRRRTTLPDDEEFFTRILIAHQIGDEAQDEEHKRLKNEIRCFCCNCTFSGGGGGIYTRRDVPLIGYRSKGM